MTIAHARSLGLTCLDYHDDLFVTFSLVMPTLVVLAQALRYIRHAAVPDPIPVKERFFHGPGSAKRLKSH
ncbi:hypothetical protein [Paenibacillus apiarius]|uniref:hypothetical protein n=1 Tax=Paenibacillus apiarius TaxID=46240 RepID=UPI00197CD3F1|nr:hypothetical protein [Paenibacillus apiarius]MBN3524631.1 hypothetical protein [Paenibacillus apiarius]